MKNNVKSVPNRDTVKTNNKALFVVLIVVAVLIVAGIVMSFLNIPGLNNSATTNEENAGAALNTLTPKDMIYKNCYEIRASSTGWGSHLYLNNTSVLVNSVSAYCRNNQEVVIAGGVACNPRSWYQLEPVYVSGSAPVYDVRLGYGWNGACTGGESQVIAVAHCCQK